MNVDVNMKIYLAQKVRRALEFHAFAQAA